MRIKNKKGFSLVELMIVVVIMGILVAVAIPLYNGVVENSQRTVCSDNQKLIRSCFAEWVLMDEANNAQTLFVNSNTSFDGRTQDAADVLDADFLARFDDGKLPGCPSEEHYFKITAVNTHEINVECILEDGSLDEKHNNS